MSLAANICESNAHLEESSWIHRKRNEERKWLASSKVSDVGEDLDCDSRVKTEKEELKSVTGSVMVYSHVSKDSMRIKSTSCLNHLVRYHKFNWAMKLPKNLTCRFLCRLIFAISVVLFIGVWINYVHESNRFAVNKNIDPSTYTLDGQILNQPPWVRRRSWGLVKRQIMVTEDDFKGGAADKEQEISWKNFFNGTSNGLILELGAVDGDAYSVSKFYEEKAGWKAILIEASPDALKIPKNRPLALSFQLAICLEQSLVHFGHGRDGTGGILEFMSPQFIKVFHPELLKEDLSGSETKVVKLLDWDKVKAAKNVAEQPCFPLQSVLDRFEIKHINFIVLDLEGGELAALKSLDFSKIEFDVICVETNRFNNEADPYIDEVVNFLTSKNYILFQRSNGRNSWFVSPNWKRLL